MLLLTIILSLLISGCSIHPKPEEKEKKSIESSSIISPKVKLNEDYYRGVLPYTPSPINGMLREIPNRLDTKYFELGLLELAKSTYNPSNYIFQEGQFLTMNEIEPLLDKDQYPQFENLVYSVNEHDYLLEDAQLGGMVVGVIVSPKYYVKENGDYKRNANGTKVTKFYTEEELIQKSKDLINELAALIKKKVNTSVLFGIMKAEEGDLKVPGTFFLSGKLKKNEQETEFNEINEKYLFLPANIRLDEEYGNIAKTFNYFKKVLNEYLPGFFGVTGTARLVDDELVELTVKVYTEFDSTVETIQFTQFAISMIDKYFPDDMIVNMYIYSIDRPKAIYVRNSSGDDFMHIYKD